MNRLNSDGHDESQYLPKGTPPVNPFRAQHEGIKWEGESIRAKTWLPDILEEQLDENAHPLLSGDQVHTCKSFLRSVVGTRNALGITDLRIYVGQPNSEAESKDIFFSIMRGLVAYQANLCLWVVCDEYNRGNISLARKLIGSIQQSLDNAQKLIDSL